jgi:hypothetical protein
MPHKKSSPYWAYFEELNEEGKKKAKCLVKTDEKQCGIVLSLKNTSCLKYHIEAIHKDIRVEKNNDEKSKSEKTTIKAALLAHSNLRYSKTSEQYEYLTSAVLSYIIDDKQAIDTVEKPSFINMLARFDKRYELPTRQSITNNLIPKKFLEVRDAIKEKLKNVLYLSITCDCWTSVANNAYIGVTAHYINNEFKLISFTLAFKHMPNSHTGESLANMLSLIFNQYEIENKVCNTVCDGASNMIKMFEFAKKVIYISNY